MLGNADRHRIQSRSREIADPRALPHRRNDGQRAGPEELRQSDGTAVQIRDLLGSA